MKPRIAATALAATLIASGSLNSRTLAQGPADQAEPSLRNAIHGRFLIGTAVMSKQLENPQLSHLIATQFNCMTGENEFKPNEIEPEPGQFDFAAADKIVAFAQRHKMKVVGHTLCWHNQTPAWMFHDQDGKPLPREQALANLKRHIDGVLGHFRGQVIGWDVVNEVISDNADEYLRDTPARRAIGDDYIIQAFRFAHAADPNAQLYYNDYGDENPDKMKKVLRLVHALQDAHMPITAVGIQAHFALAYPEEIGRLDDAISAYAAAGVKVMLSEFDVDILPRNTRGADVSATEKQGANPYVSGLPDKVAKEQADFYVGVFRVLLKHPGQVTRVTLWGTQDGTSWLNDWPIPGRTNYALLWDRQLKPKPAFRAIMHVLDAASPK